jgi:hypothetical protein
MNIPSKVKMDEDLWKDLLDALTRPLVIKLRKLAYFGQLDSESKELAEVTFKLVEKVLQTVPGPYGRDTWKVILRVSRV